MNLEELLRESLESQSATAPENPSRRVEVERRIVRRRRARIAGLAAVVAVVVVGTSAGVVTLRSNNPPPSGATAAGPGPSASPSAAPSTPPEPLPEYTSGYHRISDQQITLPGQGTLTLRYTPTSLDFVIGLNCAAVAGQLLELRVGGHRVGTEICGSDQRPPKAGAAPVVDLAGPDFNAHYNSWSDVGVRVGTPVTFTVTVGTEVEGRNGAEPSIDPPSASGDVYAGVYVSVPFDQYPLPSRPSTLADLDAQRLFNEPGFRDGLGVVDSRNQSSPSGSYTATLAMPKFLDLSLCSVAPGQIRVLVNGHQVAQTAFWDWTGGCHLGSAFSSDAPESPSITLRSIHSGQKVTVTVIASGFTAAGWRVGFDQSEY